jgi:hypothetical protein
VVVFNVDLDEQLPLLSILGQLGSLNESLGVLPTHVNSSGGVKDSRLVLVILNQFTNLIELLLLHVAVK